MIEQAILITCLTVITVGEMGVTVGILALPFAFYYDRFVNAALITIVSSAIMMGVQTIILLSILLALNVLGS